MVDLLALVLDKAELRGIDASYARRVLEAYLETHPDAKTLTHLDAAQVKKKKAFASLKRDVRSQLRKVYGVFFMPKYAAKKKPLVDALIAQPSEENARAVLALHRSTNERLPYYSFLYTQLFSVTGLPKSVLDIGCGFNPFSLCFMPPLEEYHCADIACDDLTLIDGYLSSVGVKHSTTCADLTEVENIKRLPRADVAFCLKLFDSLEETLPNCAKDILEAIPAEWVVVSFPSATIGQKTAIGPREWFLRLVTDQVVSSVTLPNEHIIIITRKKRA